MKPIKIFFSEDNKETELSVSVDGHRPDVIVQVGENLYKPTYMTFWRIKMEFEQEIKAKGYYSIDECLIIVEEVNRENIINTTLKLHIENQFFDKQLPINIMKLYPEKWRDLFNYIQVY